MLKVFKNNLYIYVVDRDFGFAPNPFHGHCTLATCKPFVRRSAQVEDWVMGVGGSRMKATGKCIYLMKVSEILTFDEYWTDKRFWAKKPVRNGSLVMMVGDNIYHRNDINEDWIQEDSHHSNPDGSANIENLTRDTKSINVLISNHFYYFGSAAPIVELSSIGYKNRIGHQKRSCEDTNVVDFVKNIEDSFRRERNIVIADPFDFSEATKTVEQTTGKIT